MLKYYINFNLYLIAFIILLFQDKFQMYQKYHDYQSEFMKDKSNDHLINGLKKEKTKIYCFFLR